MGVLDEGAYASARAEALWGVDAGVAAVFDKDIEKALDDGAYASARAEALWGVDAVSDKDIEKALDDGGGRVGGRQRDPSRGCRIRSRPSRRPPVRLPPPMTRRRRK